MKNTNLLSQLKCIIKSDCDAVEQYKTESYEEEAQAENVEPHFHPFDIDEVFAN
jgi:hypothetical protein